MHMSLSQQTESELGGHLSVLVRQKRDHVELDRLLHRLEAADATAQAPVLRSIYRLVFPHAFAEEAVLWPVMRRVLPDGEQLTLQVEQEHQEVNELVVDLDRMKPDDPRRPLRVRRLIEVLREDVRDEEDELLPRLQESLSGTQLRSLGLAWEVLRRTAPTRAHPVVARRPPGNALSAGPLTVIDRTRDVLEAVADRVGGPSGRRIAASSRRLGRLAHRIEHLPMVRSGEHPSTRADDASKDAPWLTIGIIATAGVVLLALARRRRSPR